MAETHEANCASIGMKMSLLCATLAIIGPLAFVIPYAKDLQRYSTKDNIITLASILFIVVVFYVAAAFLGKRAGNVICRKKLKLGGSVLRGIGLALCCLWFAAVLVDLSIFVAKALTGQVEPPGILTGVILLFGIPPATFLGIVYGVLVRWRLGRVLTAPPALGT